VAVLNTHVLVNHGGNVSAFRKRVAEVGLLADCKPALLVTSRAVALLASFSIFQAVLLISVPGHTFFGPVTAGGNRPVYTANGVQCFIATLGAFGATLYCGWVTATEIFLLLPSVIAAMAVSSFCFCWLLYWKGRVDPSSSDSGSSGMLLFDYYWGMELYPRLLWGQLDIKQYTNCRFGMASWALLTVAAVIAQYERQGAVADSMLVSASLVLTYIIKFFSWERGYMCSTDISTDRAGYMICWGTTVWVPAVYTAPVLFLVENPRVLGPVTTAALLSVGVAAVWVNYEADAQRLRVRSCDASNVASGAVRVWFRPAEVVAAPYVTATGECKQSLLLCSGFWGISRHFHYLPELAAALAWTLPCGPSALPYFYVAFLTILLVHRAHRDDSRCLSKYGAAWVEYCRRVPYRIVPGIY